MNPTDPRLRAALDAALKQIASTVNEAVDRLPEALGLLAHSGMHGADREVLLAAQADFRRQMDAFRLAFVADLQGRVDRALAPRTEHSRTQASTDWRSLSLVDDNEVEERVHADRIAQAISHACENELRDLAGYIGALLSARRAEPDRNPIGPETLGKALFQAIGIVSDDADTRKLLAREIGQTVAREMPACYAQIVTAMQARGLQPMELTVRGVEGPGNQLPGINTGYTPLSGIRSQHGDLDAGASDGGSDLGLLSALGGTSSTRGPPTSGGGLRGLRGGQAGTPPADAQLMALLRRLTAVASRPGAFDSRARGAGYGDHSPTGVGVPTGFAPTGERGGASIPGSISGSAAGPAGAAYSGEQLTGMMAVNLIRAHREELMQASDGRLDHMVIDVVGSLFDQILSDSRVSPHMARQIARLQLPVLRVALHDSSFFSSRRHPVRRFVNRIASLACAFDDFEEDPGLQFLGRVRSLVQEIVDGDFDQIDLYTAKLDALESFIAEQSLREAPQQAAVDTLHTKEAELRLQQRYTLQLQRALAGMSLPAYLREFLPQVWGQALVLAASRDGAASDRAQRYRRAARDLVMSVQPKGSPALRKNFLMQLPALMKNLNEGLHLIGWPEAAQREFFGKLLPAHAESLKGQPLSELDHNMLVKQLESVFNIPVPGSESLSAADEVPDVDPAIVTRRFSPEEAQRVGLVDESAVDWSGTVDIDLGADAPTDTDLQAIAELDESAAAGLGLGLGLALDLNLDLATPEPPEPTRGPQLMDHINLGFAYQMHLKDAWQKVRLAHVSAGRSFFVFTRGRKHQETISMTARMLTRMCETGRMRAVESAYLMERATLRARKQLAALKASSATQH